jgi:DNA-binding winged helix-turn-helix (wHTH) protein
MSLLRVLRIRWSVLDSCQLSKPAMPNQVGTSQVIRFATFEVDLQAQELRKAGLRLRLSGQPFQVLAILLEQPGVVVTREELQKRLWPDTFVDVDHNLNTAINKIREALGDSSENPRFVETLPRRGYRFIASITVFTCIDLSSKYNKQTFLLSLWR